MLHFNSADYLYFHYSSDDTEGTAYISLTMNISVETISLSNAHQFVQVGFQFSKIQDNDESGTVITIFDKPNEAWIDHELSTKALRIQKITAISRHD
jgi:hypothetical protein